MKIKLGLALMAATSVLVLTACTVNPEPGHCTGWTGGNISMMIVEFNMLENRTISDFRAMVQVRSGNNVTITYIHPKEPIEVKTSGAFSYEEAGDDDFKITGKFKDPVNATLSYAVTKFDGEPLDWEKMDVAISCKKPKAG